MSVPRATLVGTCVIALSLALTPPSSAVDTDELSERFRDWLEEVDLLLTEEERDEFLDLEKDYQRQAFIDAFWEARDTNPDTEVNEFKITYYARRATARDRFNSVDVDQARTFIVNGEPASVFETTCGTILWPIEIWRYAYGASIRRPFTALFYQPYASGPFQLWHPHEGLEVLFWGRPRVEGIEEIYDFLERRCPGIDLRELLGTALHVTAVEGSGPRLATSPPPPDTEWLETFRTYSTDLEPDDVTFEANLSLDFPGRHGQRTVVLGTVHVPRSELPASAAVGSFDLFGEVIAEDDDEDRLFESFRYRFELEAPASIDALPLVFERYLRPGEYELVVRVEESTTDRVVRFERHLDVPAPDLPATSTVETPASEPSPARRDAPSFRLVPPGEQLVTGAVRVDAEVTGDETDRVEFRLDGEPLLVKTRPPYSVAIDLGDLPRPRTLSATAFDAAGSELATDELVVNASPHRFAVQLRAEAVGGDRLRLRGTVDTPEGRTVDRVELYVDDDRVATLYQPPYVYELPTPSRGATFARAVAHLDTGSSREAAVGIGESGVSDRLDVDIVELYAVVVDGSGRPVDGLSADDFTVLEDGEPQTLARFEQITDLPLHVGLLIDTSASMEESLPTVRDAAFTFFDELLRPEDRATVVTFSDRPRIAARFTDDRDRLARAVGAIGAERSTTLYDSLVFTLHYFQGVQGKRALVVLSDGRDRRSDHTLDEARRFAQHAGVAVYTIDFGSGYLAGGRQLAQLAAATGGRGFSIDTADELSDVYTEIERELRRQYLLVYQAPQRGEEGFRRVEVTVKRPGLEARTAAGYFP